MSKKRVNSEIAEYYEHMAQWCHEQWGRCESVESPTAIMMLGRAAEHEETARYWREKADE